MKPWKPGKPWKPWKPLFRSERLRRLICWLASGYIRLVHATGRFEVRGGAAPVRLWRDHRPFIVAFWHGRLLMLPCVWPRGTAMHLLISEHRDGGLIADTVGHFGLTAVRGSSSRGGTMALRTMLRLLAAGDCVGITPDGPRGPRMRASDGIVQLARLAGVPVLPLTVSAARRRLLRTWDRFLVPLPFSRGVFVWGEPITVPRDADPEILEACRQEIEDRLIALTADADRACGQPTVAPDPVGARPIAPQAETGR